MNMSSYQYRDPHVKDPYSWKDTVFILRRGPGNFNGVNTLNKYYSFDAMTVYGNKLHTSLIDRSEDRNVQKGEWIYKR